MNTHTMPGKGILFGLLILFSLILLKTTSPLTFSQDPALTPDSPSSGDGLTCSWIPIDDGNMSANVTWYNNSNLYAQENEISCTNNTLCSTPIGIPGSAIYRGNFWNCTVLLYNDTASITKSVKVNISNADPVMASIGNVSVLEDVANSTTVTATDVEGDTLTWFSNDANFSSDLFIINQDTGVISFTPTASDIGNHTMDIIVIDGNGGSDAERAVFNIISVDDRPAFTSSMSNQTINEAETYLRLITASDEEANTFNFTLATNLSSLILIWNSNTSANLTFDRPGNAPNYSDSGNWTVNITIYEIDNTSVNTTASFNLDVRPVNHDPILDFIPQQNATQGQNLVVNVSATDIDPGEALAFSISTNCSLNNPWTITTSVSASPALGYINLTLNNSHVACRYVNITVTDTKTIDSQIVFMNITNTNDLPVIYNISTYAGNTGGNNITNLTGYFGSLFTYGVNATDIDTLTYANDTISYTSNDSLFPIDTAGIISFDINDSLIGNHTVKITATDLSLSSYTEDMHVEFHNNTIPLLSTIAPISCAEDILCTRFIEAYEPDPGDTLTFETNDTTHFPLTAYNTTARLVNFTPTENMIGNHSIIVRVTDNHGAEDNESFNITINNTNDLPFFDMNEDNTSDSITFGIIVEDHMYTYLVNATDHDMQFGDNLTFDVTFITGQALFSITKIGNRTGRINFTPNTSSDGNYSVNCTVSDLSNASAWQVFNFTVHNQSFPPIIDLIKPYYNTTLARTVFSYENASLFASANTNINFSENTTVTFNATTYDPDGSILNLTLYWYRDNVLNTSTTATANDGITIFFGFFDSGTTTFNLTVQDGFFSTDSFRWTATVADVNRPPVILSTPANLTGSTTVNASTQLIGYFSYYDGAQRFLDPDDDRNGNSQIRDNTTDPDETFTLNITMTSCTYATLSVSGSMLTVEPLEIGTCFVNFTATDGSLSVTSTQVRIDIGAVPAGEDTPTPVSGTGGSGGSSSRRVVIPKKTNVDIPKAVELVVPGRVIMYENRTMNVPIILRNTWNGTLTGITLHAFTNNSRTNMSFSQDFFPTLDINQEVTSTLIVENYREAGPYEIYITANVTEPRFSDTGTVFINSIEQTEQGSDVDIKITFARDLLTSNKECQELNELLDKADAAREDRNYDLAIILVDSAVNGCKYLLNERKEIKKENPEQTLQTLFSGYLKSYGILALIGLFLLIIILVIILISLKRQEITELKKLE
jgi:hypothetical protein